MKKNKKKYEKPEILSTKAKASESAVFLDCAECGIGCSSTVTDPGGGPGWI